MLLGAIGGLFLATWNQGDFVLADTSDTNQTPLALNAYLYLKVSGDSQGDIDGDSTDAGREGLIVCVSYQHSVISPRDAASGLPTGKRQHKPFVLTKLIDKASPLLFQAFTTNENLNVSLLFYSGTDTINYYEINLEGAQILSIQSFRQMPPDPLGDALPIEEVSFVYQTITWYHKSAGISHSDSIVDD